jgi:2-polyprenyl-3-methyl-5-hydroxy-6-metoxy-1,4-benzoquinol methylase
MSYSQRILQQGNQLTRLAHRSRFSAVLDAIGSEKYTQALDYGCGDGWLLKNAYDMGIITSGIGIDVDPSMLSASEELFAALPNFKFFHVRETDKIAPQSCDLIFCTETLEHVDDVQTAIERMIACAKPNAKMIISVPIELGPALLVKQIGRYLANLKGSYGYEKYSPKELFSAAILWDTNSFPSSHSLNEPNKGHKGFDYRNMEKLLRNKLKIQQTIFSPFPGLGNLLNSTIIWICQVEK